MQVDGLAAEEKYGQDVGLPPLAKAMDEVGLKEVETYESCFHNMVTQYITTRTVMDQ